MNLQYQNFTCASFNFRLLNLTEFKSSFGPVFHFCFRLFPFCLGDVHLHAKFREFYPWSSRYTYSVWCTQINVGFHAALRLLTSQLHGVPGNYQSS